MKWILTNYTNPSRVQLVALAVRSEDPEDFVDFPSHPSLSGFDRADRKFVALCKASSYGPHIVNATDSDWAKHWDALKSNGIMVVFLCPELMPGMVSEPHRWPAVGRPPGLTARARRRARNTKV